jgi:hypothetical protein
MAEKNNNNFDWIADYKPKTDIGQKLLTLYHTASHKINWSPALDAAIRIILYAAQGNLASCDENKAVLQTISKKISCNYLYASDIILLACDIVGNEYFFFSNNDLLDKKHIDIVIDFQKEIPIEHRINLCRT